MYVRVDRDRRDPVSEDEDAVRGLGTDAGKRGQLLEGPGDRAGEPVEDLVRDDPKHVGLHTVEAGHPDQGLDVGPLRTGERRSVREPGEETGARNVGVRVAGALREDRADEDLERVLGVVP
jgi:hypothetical protein